ncbi:MAG: hypothetical protein J7576_24210 [Siphonobacter aquaeclarae]|nr:hypothetical protein [Siphonobacter aquaeclarae]
MHYQHGYFTDRILHYLLEYHRDLVPALTWLLFSKHSPKRLSTGTWNMTGQV